MTPNAAFLLGLGLQWLAPAVGLALVAARWRRAPRAAALAVPALGLLAGLWGEALGRVYFRWQLPAAAEDALSWVVGVSPVAWVLLAVAATADRPAGGRHAG